MSCHLFILIKIEYLLHPSTVVDTGDIAYIPAGHINSKLINY